MFWIDLRAVGLAWRGIIVVIVIAVGFGMEAQMLALDVGIRWIRR